MSAAVKTTGSGVTVLKLAPEFAFDKVLCEVPSFLFALRSILAV